DAAPRPAEPVRRAVVVGGGTMGAGITHALLVAGVHVRLIELEPSAVSAALRRVQAMLDSDRRDRRLSPVQARQAMERLAPSTEWTGLRLADVAIEAVVEKPSLKQEVFEKLGRLTRDDAVLATNTSALDIPTLARAAGRAQQVIGMHFFNPVPKMPLVEIVRTEASSAEAVGVGVALAERIGKTPIVVNHGPAFLVNRLLLPGLAEALAMVAEGVAPRVLDNELRRWGMPMGPCELLDYVGLDVAVDIIEALQPRLGDRLTLPAGMDAAVSNGWLGRKSGRGFYVYGASRPRLPWQHIPPQEHEALLRRLRQGHGTATVELDDAVLQRRVVLPMVNEAARTLVEGITDSTDLIDLATVLGLGLAPFRGGLVHHAESIGLADVVRQLDELAARHGKRFEPTPELRAAAAEGAPMQALARSWREGAQSDTAAGRDIGARTPH
ncbi:MAG: 3-hydroxyacyl-CoA dehydrogenase NAD-binding domain-containing protein, partial [Phycisphaeraceae bacterium]